MENYDRAGHATDDNMAHAHCLLDTKGFKYTLRMCNIIFFPSATIVARTRVNVSLDVLCLFCFYVIQGVSK